MDEQRLNREREIDIRVNAAKMVGGYYACKRLLTSPRFNRPQREIIEEVAQEYRECAEVQGVTFEGASDA